MKNKIILFSCILFFCLLIGINVSVVFDNSKDSESLGFTLNGIAEGRSDSEDDDEVYYAKRIMADFCFTSSLHIKECVSATCEINYSPTSCDEDYVKSFDTCEKTCGL